MKFRVALYSLFVALTGCGDNSNECDPGTTRNENGVCVGNLACSDGTILVDGKCEIDPNACQGGTVLVGGQCVDPGVLKADLEEGAEPNGLGLIEQSLDPAGEIVLKPEGQQFVIHGKIAPFRDEDGDGQQDADLDTYVLEVTEPTLLTISTDGVNGLQAGFISVAAVSSSNPMSDWTRFGVNLTGDTSKRQLFLPVPGVYLIGIGDTRTMFLSGGAAGAGEGKPAYEYYVSIEKNPINPTALTVTNGVAASTGMRQPGEVKLFSVALGEGVNNVELETAVAQVQASVVVTNKRANTLKLLGIGDAQDPDPASVGALGVRTGDTALIAADSVFDYTNQPHGYDLRVSAGSAGALSTSGGNVSQPASAIDFSTFYYDVSPDNLLIGMNLAFNKPVTGVVVDENFFIFSFFTFDPSFGFFFGDTFQSYKGLIKHATPGRYYFLTFDPTFTSASAPADLTATSSYMGLTAMPIVKGTPLTNVAINAFESNPFTYTPGAATDPWQAFTGSGTNTGTITAAFFEPNSAIGRLDTLANTCGIDCDDRPVPVFSQTYAEAGTTRGRILLDNANVNQFLVTINTVTVTGSPTFNLDYAPQANVTDFGTATIGTPLNANAKPLDATTTVQRFLVRTVANNRVQITATPGAGLDTRIQRINADESANGTLVNNGAVGAADSTVLLQGTSGWTAFTVTKTGSDGTFDANVVVLAPVVYGTAAGTTAFAHVCVDGTAVAMSNLDEGRSNALINTPTGFDYFGFPVPQLRVFANGFASFDTALNCAGTGTSCFFTNADMPAAANPNAVVAPYWDDLVLTSVCQKAAGSQLIVQWRGTLFSDATQAVEMQAILDGSNDTIEFVYGPAHNATGSGATIGIENQNGTAAKKLSFNTAAAPAPTLFTPM